MFIPSSVAEIAEQVGLNHIYLNRIFKLSTGKTLSEYLNIYRIEQSKDMLCNTNHSVAEISKLLGYNDVRSYIRFFKKFVGVTPGDYRN
ncbi:MAG: helix-turn-helix transcriptional regulator [Epulopiscium sp.]|nr:helix-turn-helix transcriptional regulator [Candidatus Epulonipiscium sp.]